MAADPKDWKPTEIQIFTCAEHDHLTTRPDAHHRMPAPLCPVCCKPTIHSSPATAQEILKRVREKQTG